MQSLYTYSFKGYKEGNLKGGGERDLIERNRQIDNSSIPL